MDLTSSSSKRDLRRSSRMDPAGASANGGEDSFDIHEHVRKGLLAQGQGQVKVVSSGRGES